MTTDRKHPKALPFLFLTEMWERFGFYVVQGMLVLYMTKPLGMSDDASYTIMGVFSALAYISPFIGGSIADRLLGFKTSIIWGGIFLSAGYAMLATPWSFNTISVPIGSYTLTLAASQFLYISLATIIVGNGLFKPNISSLLGTLYEPGDPNRESGFTLFYIGINLGVLLAGLTSGYIKDHFGWHAGFGLASLGLIIGIITFSISIKKLAELKNNPMDALPEMSFFGRAMIILGCLLMIVLLSVLLQNKFFSTWLLPIAGVFLLFFLFILTSKQEPDVRKRLLTLISLIVSSIIFWMIFLQIFLSTNLFIERLVQRDWSGIHIPTTVFYASEAVFVMLLGPIFAWTWHALSIANKNPSAFSKFIIAMVFAGLAYVVLVMGTYFKNAEGLINPLWILLSYLSVTIGEMLLSPIGLSAVTTLAPRHLIGMMMGIWMVALGFGGGFAGWLAKLANIPDGIKNLDTWMLIYRQAFTDYALIAFGVAILLLVIRLFFKKFFESEH